MLLDCLTETIKILPIESGVLDFMGRPQVSLVDGLTIIAILGTMGVLSGYFQPAKPLLSRRLNHLGMSKAQIVVNHTEKSKL